MAEYLMLAKTYDPSKHPIGGSLVSTKLDGQRAFWDGGISRGKLKASIPYANTAKDDRYIEDQYATGLWSRYGNVIHAPDWWLDQLPTNHCLDGELYSTNLVRENLFSITSSMAKSKDWRYVNYYVFDIPSIDAFLEYRRINNPNQSMKIQGAGELVVPNSLSKVLVATQVTWLLNKGVGTGDVIVPVKQNVLPIHETEARKQLDKWLDYAIDNDEEGLMIRKAHTTWKPERGTNILKVKPLDDHEGIVIGYTTGAETNKGSKLRGKLGALILNTTGPKGVVSFELSGFTDAERQLSTEAATWAYDNPGCILPTHLMQNASSLFPTGIVVAYKHRGWTRDGVPMEARYSR